MGSTGRTNPDGHAPLWGIEQPYEKLKALTRGQEGITKATLAEFIDGLQLPEAVKKELKQLTPATYTGNRQSAGVGHLIFPATVKAGPMLHLAASAHCTNRKHPTTYAQRNPSLFTTLWSSQLNIC